MSHIRGMDAIEALLQRLPPETEDLATNLRRVLAGESMDAELTWGVALAAAYHIGRTELSAAVLADARAAGVPDAVLEDARAAAAIMGMNAVYYRFRHLMDSATYNERPANLRMTRMQKVATTRARFELLSVGPAALAGCQMCLQVHEAAVLKDGMTADNVHDAVRVASVLNGVAVALAAAEA